MKMIMKISANERIKKNNKQSRNMRIS